MNKLWWAASVTVILAACGSQEVKQSSFDMEQRRQMAQESASREAAVRREQEELARARQRQRKASESSPFTAQTEAPVIRPIAPDNFSQDRLPAGNAALETSESFLEKRTIYYDYDAYNVKEDYRKIVEAHGMFLLMHRDLKLRIEGNCDERGSREYNLALGQRRADSVKRALTLLGVPAAQIETVSFGSEKPRATSHDEQAYAENRRSDLVYLGSKSVSR